MARPKNEFETWLDRFPLGTKARIEAALKPPEKRADLVRHAVQTELKRRERQKP